MGQKIIYVKMTKVWAQFPIGDIVRFGESKGRSRIDLAMGHEVSKSEYDKQQQKRVVKKPIAETATNSPGGETAELSPVMIEKKAQLNLERGPLSDEEKELLEELLEKNIAKSGPNIGRFKAATKLDVIQQIENLQARCTGNSQQIIPLSEDEKELLENLLRENAIDDGSDGSNGFEFKPEIDPNVKRQIEDLLARTKLSGE